MTYTSVCNLGLSIRSLTGIATGFGESWKRRPHLRGIEHDRAAFQKNIAQLDDA